MKKFWKWMKKKYDYEENIIYEGDMDGVYFEKQMLIGYMIEYLIDNSAIDFIIGKCWNCKFYNGLNIDEIYDMLKQKIEVIA